MKHFLKICLLLSVLGCERRSTYPQIDIELDTLDLRHVLTSREHSKAGLILKFDRLQDKCFIALRYNPAYLDPFSNPEDYLSIGDSVIKPPFQDSAIIVHANIRRRYLISWFGDSLRRRAGDTLNSDS